MNVRSLKQLHVVDCMGTFHRMSLIIDVFKSLAVDKCGVIHIPA